MEAGRVCNGGVDVAKEVVELVLELAAHLLLSDVWGQGSRPPRGEAGAPLLTIAARGRGMGGGEIRGKR